MQRQNDEQKEMLIRELTEVCSRIMKMNWESV